MKKAGGHIGRNVVNIKTKMKTIVRKSWTIKSSIWLIGQLLQLRIWVDLGANTMKGYSSIIGSLLSGCLVSYPGHSLGGVVYPSAEMQSVYSISPSWLDQRSSSRAPILWPFVWPSYVYYLLLYRKLCLVLDISSRNTLTEFLAEE